MTHIPQIELGNVVPGAERLPSAESGINDTFIGHIDAPSGRHKAYIKVLSGKQLINELVATTVGRALNMPIPPGYLLRVRPHDLPESQSLQRHGTEALIFGSRAINQPTLLRRFIVNTSDAEDWMRNNFNLLDEAMIFDEWIANPDRHPGNLIVGGTNQVWLIDHSHCFTGPNWQAYQLQADLAYRNHLGELCIPSLTLPNRVALKNKANIMTESLTSVNIENAMQLSFADRLLNSTDLEALTGFLSDRIPHITKIVCERIGMPSLS